MKKVLLGIIITGLLATPAIAGGDEASIQDLYGKTWVAEYILDKPVIDASRSSIEFRPDGKVGGLGGCNNYFANYEVKNGKLKIGPAGATMKMCPEALMDQERRFMAALSKITGYYLENGGLNLTTDDGKKVVFFPQ